MLSAYDTILIDDIKVSHSVMKGFRIWLLQEQEAEMRYTVYYTS